MIKFKKTKIFILIITLLISNFSILFLALDKTLNGLERNNIFGLVNKEKIDDVFLDTSLSSYSVNQEPKEEIPELKEIYNILIIGIDEISDNEDIYSRSDSMMVLSIDPINKQLKLTSLLRDSYVDIPGYWKTKLNAAFAYGGPELLIDTIYENFNLKIDKYAYTDFDAFKEMVNLVGGIEMELSKEETYHVYFRNGIPAGKYLLNGDEALNYCRIRKLDSDFGRVERQQKFLQAVYNKFKNKNMFEILDIASSILPYIHTNLTNNEIYLTIKQVIQIGNMKVYKQTIPAENTYRGDMIDGQNVIVMDIKENAYILKKFINERQE